MGDHRLREYRFGRYRLQPDERQLLVDGAPAKLGARAFDLLRTLVERRDRTVTRAELFEQVWPGRVVEDQNLQVQVVTLRKLLGPHAIATIPGRGYRFALPLEGDRPAPATPDAPAELPPAAVEGPVSTNLPADLPALYGRTQDIVAVLRLLGEHRLVTLAGPGGIGKTRLAQAVAFQLRARFPDGVWFVDLAALNDPEALPATVARAVGFPPSQPLASVDGLARALGGTSLLLVLDNCEHVLEAAGHLAAAILRAAPRVVVLSTSQEALRVEAELLYRVGPLAAPEPDAISAAGDYGAVALFTARVGSLMPGFALTDANASPVIEICRRLDGIPLALELAAARVPLLGVDGVRARLDERFRLLTAGARNAPSRQQTLRNALEWSHGLLSAEQQLVFRRLAVFAGSFALEAAQRIVGGDGDLDEWAVLDHLGALVDKSLVHVLPGGRPRYRLLESARAFALGRLEAAGEGEALAARHAEFVRAHWHEADDRFYALPARQWLLENEPEIDDLRAALRWATADARRRSDAVALAVYSVSLFNRIGLPAEARRWCESVRRWAEAETDPAWRGRFALAVAVLAAQGFVYPPDEGLDVARQAVSDFEAAGDPVRRYYAMHLVYVLTLRVDPASDRVGLLDELQRMERADFSEMLKRCGRFDRAYEDRLAGRTDAYLAFCREEAARCRRLGATTEGWAVAQHLMLAEQDAGRPQEAIDVGRKAIDEIRAAGMVRHHDLLVAIWINMLADSGDAHATRAALSEFLPMLRSMGTAWIDGLALAWVALLEGRATDAATALGWYDRATRDAGAGVRGPFSDRSRARLLQRLDAELGADERERLRLAGEALDERAALGIALAAAA